MPPSRRAPSPMQRDGTGRLGWGVLRLPEQHDSVGIGAEAVVLDAPDIGGLGEARR